MQYQIRKLGVGGILDQTINVVKDNFGLLFTIYAITAMPFQIASIFFQYSDPRRPGQVNPDYLAPFLLIALLSVVATLVFNAATIHGVASLYISRPTSLGECISTGFRRFFPMLWTGILMGLAVMGAAIVIYLPGVFVMGMLGLPLPLVYIGLLALMIPIFILVMWWCLAQEITVLEHISGSDALGRSKKLMRNNMGKAFVMGLILAVIVYGIPLGVGPLLIRQPLLLTALLSVIQAATSILTSAALVVLYFSARCEHENFDLQMLTSAVAEDYESPR